MTSSWIDEKPQTSKDSVGKYEEKRAHSETYSGPLCKDGTEKKIWFRFLDWIELACDRIRGWAVVNVPKKLRVQKKRQEIPVRRSAIDDL